MCLSILIKRMGFRILRALNGPDGIKIAREAQPSLIILDIRMPGKDGFQILKALKGDNSTADIPVVIYTVEGDESRAKCEALGCSGYLKKPATLSEMHRILQSFCSDPGHPGRKCLRADFHRFVLLVREHSAERF